MRDFSESFDPSRGIYGDDQLQQQSKAYADECQCPDCRYDDGHGVSLDELYGPRMNAPIDGIAADPDVVEAGHPKTVNLDFEPSITELEDAYEDGVEDATTAQAEMIDYLEGFAEGINHAVALMRLTIR